MEPLTQGNSWKSPCKSICRLDRESGLCAGCWRSLEEIGTWIRFSNDEKKAACARAEQRRKNAEPALRERLENLAHADIARR